MEEYSRTYDVLMPNGQKDDRRLARTLKERGYELSCRDILCPTVKGTVGEVAYFEKGIFHPVHCARVTIKTSTREGKDLATFLAELKKL